MGPLARVEVGPVLAHPGPHGRGRHESLQAVAVERARPGKRVAGRAAHRHVPRLRVRQAVDGPPAVDHAHAQAGADGHVGRAAARARLPTGTRPARWRSRPCRRSPARPACRPARRPAGSPTSRASAWPAARRWPGRAARTRRRPARRAPGRPAARRRCRAASRPVAAGTCASSVTRPLSIAATRVDVPPVSIPTMAMRQSQHRPRYHAWADDDTAPARARPRHRHRVRGAGHVGLLPLRDGPHPRGAAGRPGRVAHRHRHGGDGPGPGIHRRGLASPALFARASQARLLAAAMAMLALASAGFALHGTSRRRSRPPSCSASAARCRPSSCRSSWSRGSPTRGPWASRRPTSGRARSGWRRRW